MKKKRLHSTTKFLILSIIMSFIFFTCKKTEQDISETSTVKTANQTHPGTPYKAHYHTVTSNEKSIMFGIITDSHINCNYWPDHDNDHMKKNKRVIDDINYDIKHWAQNENFIVHLGDAINTENLQNLVAFRQIYENDYPGSDGGSIADHTDTDDAYSNGHKIKIPLYINIGNHGAPGPSDGWNYMRNYVTNRMKHFYKDNDYHNYDCYYWKSGRFLFIHAGLSVCSYAKEKDGDGSVFDEGKLSWIKNVLDTHAPDSTTGVFILQHYGWDYFSKEDRWWTGEMRTRMIDLLCRRENTNQIAHPYNVLGILTGHVHDQGHARIHAGYTEDGEDVWFDNYYFDDSFGDGYYGYSHLYVNNGDTLFIHHKKYSGSDDKGWDKSVGKRVRILD